MNRKSLHQKFSMVHREGLKKVATLAVRHLKAKVQVSMLQRFPIFAKSFSPVLFQVFLEPTNHCNLHCRMCYRGERKTGFMDYTLFTRLIDEIAAVGNVSLILHLGGESLLHPKFPDMLEYAMSRRDRLRSVGFFTNGTLLDSKAQKKLVDLGVDWVSISLEGLGKTNDEIRIGSDYEQVKANVKGLLDKRGRIPKPEVGLALTDTGQREIDDFVNAWVSSVDHIRVCASFNSQLQIVNPRFFNGHKTVTSDHCLMPCYTMAILWNGDVVACCANVNGHDVLGNVVDTQILDVWKGTEYRQLRYNLLKGKPKGLCFSCNTWKTRFSNHSQDFENYNVSFYDIMKQYRARKDRAS